MAPADNALAPLPRVAVRKETGLRSAGGTLWKPAVYSSATSFVAVGQITRLRRFASVAAQACGGDSTEGGRILAASARVRLPPVPLPIIRLLPEWDAGTVELNAIYVSGRAAKPSARAVVDYLIAALHESGPPSTGENPRPSA